MKVHRMEKVWIVASVLLIVGFIGTITYGAVGYGVRMIGDEGGTVEGPNNPTASPNFKQPGIYRVSENHYEAYVLAKQFFFQPGTSKPIRVPEGSRITFYITSGDVIHGFNLIGTNVNVMAIPGQVGKITVRFEEPGTYGLVCHEYCGVGHHLMEGRLEVVPAAEFTVEESQ